MSEFNLEESLKKIADVLGNRFDEMFESQRKLKERIEQLEQENKKLLKENEELRNGNEHYGIIIASLDEKSKKLLKENEELKQENHRISVENKKLYQTMKEMVKDSSMSNSDEKVNVLNKTLLAYWEENVKLMQSNQHLTNEIEKLKSEIKWLSDENIKLSLIKGKHTQNC